MKRILRLIQWFTFLSLLFHYPRRRTPTREESTMMNVSLRAFTFDTSRLLRICPTFAKCLVPPPKPSPGIKRSDAYQGRRSTKIYNYAPDVPRERSHLNCVWSVGRFVATFDAEFNQRVGLRDEGGFSFSQSATSTSSSSLRSFWVVVGGHQSATHPCNNPRPQAFYSSAGRTFLTHTRIETTIKITAHLSSSIPGILSAAWPVDVTEVGPLKN